MKNNLNEEWSCRGIMQVGSKESQALGRTDEARSTCVINNLGNIYLRPHFGVSCGAMLNDCGYSMIVRIPVGDSPRLSPLLHRVSSSPY